MTQLFVNNFRSRLAAPLAADATVMYLESVAGLPQMSPEDGNTLNVTIFRGEGSSESGWEVVTITSRVGNACKVIRSTEGAAQSLFTVENTRVEARLTAGSLNRFMESWSQFAPRTLVSDLANGIDESKGSGQIAHAGQNLRTYLLGMSSRVETIQSAQSAGVVGKNTLPDLNADLAHAADTVAYVLLDPTPDNNTTYIKHGAAGSGSWERSSATPSSVLAKRVDENAVQAAIMQWAISALNKSDPSAAYPDDLQYAVVDENGDPILAVKQNGTVHAVLDTLPGLSMLNEEFMYANCDADGYVLWGIRWDGSIYPDTAPTPSNEATFDHLMLDAQFATATCDADGYVVFGIEWDGAVYFNGISQAGVAEVFINQGDLWAMSPSAKPVQVTEGVDIADPRNSGGTINYLASTNGGLVRAAAPLPSPDAWAPFITKIIHLIGSGQSLSMGTNSTPYSHNPHCANRIRTLNVGVETITRGNAFVLTEADCIPTKPLVVEYREVPMIQCAAQIQRNKAIPVGAGIVASMHGWGGRPVAELAKGSQFYANALAAAAAVKSEAASLGLAYEVHYVDWIQGEANRADAPGVYTAQLLQLQSDFDTDLRAITGGQKAIPLLLDQISNWTAYNLTTCSVPLEQLQMALVYPSRVVCAGPKYWALTGSDGVHLPSLSSRRLGAMHARAAEAILNGQCWLPTHCVSAIRVDNIVTLKFFTPFGRLVADTVNVSDPGHYGIRWIDSAASSEVANVKVGLDNTVTVTLTAIPTGLNGTIGIADIGTYGADGGPFTGARACLRDSSLDKCGDGLPVWNWACHQQIAVIH